VGPGVGMDAVAKKVTIRLQTNSVYRFYSNKIKCDHFIHVQSE